MSTLAALNASTIRLLGGTQVITSVFSVVKELIENALDAGASTIDIRLENYGLDKVEVRDNGIGIPTQNVPFVAKRYHTSKIESFSDIQHLQTYGFRGEALGSLCTVSTLSITTKTGEDEVSLSYAFNNQGQIISSHPSHLTQGTTVTATGLFKNIPVRRQFYNTNKKKKEEIKRIEDLLVAFSIILPKVRFTLNHDKERLFQKNGCPDIRTAMLSILGRNVLNCLVQKTVQLEDSKINIDMFLPNPASDVLITSKSDNSRCICAINRRPVHLKDMEKLIRQHYVSHKKTDNHRHPIYFLSVTLETDQIDVNVDPNKTIVLLHQKAEITKGLISVLEELYGSISKSIDDTTTNHDNSYTDSNKGDMSSDFDDSLVVIPVTSKQPNIPVVKISTDNKNIVLTKHDLPETISEKLEQGIENNVSNTIYNDDLEKEENISLTQLGKPVFQVVEESLDDWINEKNDNVSSTKSKQTERNVADIENTPTNIIQNIEKGQDPGTSNKHLNKLSVNQIPSNIHFESNPKLCDIYSDIVSTWKDSPSEDGPEIPVKLPEVQCESTCLSDNQNSCQKGQNKGIGVDVVTNDINEENLCQTRGNETTSGSADMWSRGKSLTNDSTDIQPVTILPGKRLMSLSEGDEGPPLKKRLVIPQEEGQRRLSDILSSQPVKHPQTAFILYCKDNRSRVIAENPLADYDKVTRILENRWEDLPDEDKDKYFQKKSPVKTKIKRTSIGSEKERNLCSKMKQQNKSSKSWTTIKDQLLKQKISSALQKTKNVSFSLQNLKTVFSQKMFASQSQNSSHVNLIGPLKTCGVWIGCHGNCLKFINPHRIQETILYHNLMANHVVQTEKLEQPMLLTKNHLGETLWTTLTSLADQMCSSGIYNVIQDKRLTANGIGITFHREEGEFTAKITELSRCIPVYGQADVKEVLQLISTTKAITVAEARPLKVLNYLQGEAVRMARQLPRQLSRDDMIDILIQRETMLPLKCENCLHNKPFYHTVYSINDIPLTQSQT
ncbi:PMS1 protein homolog 1-like [Mytilus californianus]|uniref:PMS1 protein homolog 1-like n=1 Tax=Mytilus californianus TaxID=6549 RepID=UPI0022470FE3|nr:PMS1 protein homolog 1-like [Mytilus californianus]